MSQVFDSDYFKNYTPSPELLQQVRDDPRFPEFKSWAESWLEKTGAGIVAPAIAPAIAPEAIRPTPEVFELTPEEEAHFVQNVTSWKPGYVFKWTNLEGKEFHVKTEEELQKLINKDIARLKKGK